VFVMGPVRRLLLGKALELLGTAVVPTALTLTIVGARQSGGALGLVLACELVPQLVLLPLGGVLASRVRPRRLALAANVVRGLAQLGIAVELLLAGIRVPDLAALSVVTGVAIAFGTPTQSPLVVAAVPAAERLRVNGRLGVLRGAALVVGPSIVGVLVVTVGPGWLFLANGVVFFAAGALIGGLRLTDRIRRDEQPSFFRDLADGWWEVRRRPWFWTNLIGHGVSNLAAGIFATLGPLIAVRALGGEVGWVVIYQCGMVGMVIGSLVVARLPARRPLVTTSLAGAIFGLPLVTMSVSAPVAVDAAAYFVSMLGLGVLNALWASVLQQHFPPHALSRADSYDALLSYAARPLGLALAAPVAAVTGDAVVLVGAAVLVAVCNAGLLVLPDVRRLGLGLGTGARGADVAEAVPDPG
jgi:MFS transporter